METYKEVNGLIHLAEIKKLICREVEFMKTQGSPLKDIANMCNLEAFLRKIHNYGRLIAWEDAEGNFIGAVGASLASLWWTDGENAVMEEFVIGNHPGFGRIALRYLERLAHQYNCKIIYSGNFLGTQPKQVENLYMRKGNFDVIRNNFIKVVR